VKSASVSSQSTAQILRYNGTTGAFLGVFVDAGTGGLSSPFDIVFNGAGDLLVANSSTSEILRFDGATGAFVDVFASGGVPGLNTPRGLATDGLSLFTSAEGDRIYQFDATDGSFIASFSGNDNPRAMTFGPDGNLYYTQNVSDNVVRRDGVTGAVIGEFVSHQSGGLGSSLGLAFGPDGNLYVGNRGDGNVLRFDGTTGAFIDAFVSSGSGGLGEPGALLFTQDPTPVPEPDGALLFSAGLAALLLSVRKSVGG